MSNSAPLQPARIEFHNGLPHAPAFDDIYHSGAGALAQAKHVFLGGNALPRRFQNAARFTVLETGFGLGLNFLATWRAWREHASPGARLDYLAVEKHPPRSDDLDLVLRAFPELEREAKELVARWPWLMGGVYRLEFESGRVALSLAFGEALAGLRSLTAEADAVYLDGFSPAKNPEMWSPELVAEVARRMRPGATLATWSVAAGVREALLTAGLVVEKQPGLPPKREMLVARAPGEWKPRAAAVGDTLVIGCGYAGALTAHRLARHGQRVTVLERRSAPATEISGNLAGLLLPALNPSDTVGAQYSRVAFAYALQCVQEFAQFDSQVAWGSCGVLQIAALDEEFEKMRDIIATHGVPQELARLVNGEEAMALAGGPVPRGGLWYERGAWIRPASIVRAALASAAPNIDARFGIEVARLDRAADGWRAIDAGGRVIVEAKTVVLAPGNALASFAQSKPIPIIPARGQLTYLQSANRHLPVAVCGDGYAVPLPDGRVILGTTFDRDDEANIRISDHEKNLRRVAALLPGFVPEVDATTLDGRVGFRATSPDRLPYAGWLPQWETQGPECLREPGLAVLAGLGARGLVWAPLAAEYLACLIAGDPLPIADHIAEALDPRRVWARRRGKPGCMPQKKGRRSG